VDEHSLMTGSVELHDLLAQIAKKPPLVMAALALSECLGGNYGVKV